MFLAKTNTGYNPHDKITRPSAMIPQRLYKTTLLLLLISGFSALVYEVTWVRLLALTFGVSVYAAAGVLTAYMGGMALGSWLFGRLIARRPERFDRPGALLKLFALLEIGVGIFAALTPVIFIWLTAFYVWIARQFSPDFYSYNLIRFGLSALVLSLPTLLMGGTFPVISHLLARKEEQRGFDLGNLYALNTLGGVLGTLAAGLFLIRTLGTANTIYLAASLDGLVAVGALLLARQAFSTSPVAPARTRSQRQKRRGQTGRSKSLAGVVQERPTSFQTKLILWGYAISGFTALGYEVVWTRLLAIFSLNAIFSFTIMLATFLTGLAAGSYFAARWVDHSPRPVRLFGVLQVGIGLSAVLVLFIFSILPDFLAGFIQGVDFSTQALVEFSSAGLTMIIPTLLMGASFPVAARVYTLSTQAVGERVGRLYALNTLGSMLGSLTAGFVLISFLGLQRSAVSLAVVNLALGAAVLLSSAQIPRLQLAGALTLAVAGIWLLPPGIYLGREEGRPSSLVYYHEGIDATVSVFEDPATKFKVSYVNGRSEVPTDPHSLRAFHLLGHLPPLLHPQAQSALMVSFGNGIASGAMSQHGLARIESVELVAEQVEVARLYTVENRNVLDYPGLNITIEDGRNYLLRTDEIFDIITVDATHPVNSSSWALFTQQFYQMARARLDRNGVMIQWLPFHDLSQKDYREIVRTFQSVFPHTTLWYSGAIHTFLVGTPEPLTREAVLALDERLKTSGAAADLGDAQRLALDYLMDEAAVADYTAGARIVSDDRAFFLPALEVEAIMQGFIPYYQR